MKYLLQIDGEAIPVRPSEEHEFLLETKLVAKGYGVSAATLRTHKRDHIDELVKGKHWIRVQNLNAVTGVGNPNARQSGLRRGNDTVTLWTKRGIVRLGFFIRSERAKRFRDAAEDMVIAAVGGGRSDDSLAVLFERAAGVLRAGGTLAQALALVSPAMPYGSISRSTKRPRTRLVPAYYTSRFDRDAATIRFLGLQVAMQRDFLAELLGGETAA